MDDFIIRGGTVIDGSGAPGARADVAVRNGRIAAIGNDLTAGGAREIDAAGRIVCPGFIDIKTHSDWTLPLMPQAESKIRQGVTTEVIGHCGYSCAPVLPGKVELIRDYLSPSAPWLTFFETGYAGYLEGYPQTAVNRAMLVGHNTLRLMTMGLEDRPPEPAELEQMKRLLEEALEAGAIGMSSGLFTAPGSYAEGEELVELGSVLRRRGGLYFTHLRDESNTVFDSVQEAIEFGERTGVHVQIVHVKLSGTDNWGGAQTLLDLLAAARARGVAIDCDQYPYVAASNPLKNLFPAWLQEGGVDALLARLGDAEARTRVRCEVEADGLNNFGRIPDWDAIRISISPDLPQYAGRTIAEIAAERGRDGFETALDYIVEDRAQTRVLVSSISEDDVQTLIRSPAIMIGSDGNSVAPYGVTGQGKPHPRFYGTFAKVLGHYARDLGLLPLHTAVHKMTGASAAALGLADRGLLREGWRADITVFDPDTVAERATYQDPHRYATGIDAVFVNGVSVLEQERHTGALPGQVLRRQPAANSR
ncbi:MAG: amidohydrolase family protein [Alphaproteobacteria bacterium]|nr:amidohydrolase family protein [Alphaproteobacteria bacterium]